MSAKKDELDEVGKGGSGKKNIIILIVAALALVGASVGVTVMMLGKADQTAAAGHAGKGEKAKKKSKKAEAEAADEEKKTEAKGEHGEADKAKAGEDKAEGEAPAEEEGKGHKASSKHAAADEEAEAEEDEEEADEEGGEEGKNHQFYVEFAPAFVVNLPSRDKSSRTRFLKIEVSGVSKEEKIEEEAKKHMPAIRNRLVMLFSKQFYEDLLSADGKENLRKQALLDVQKAMKKAAGKKLFKDLYFTSFVMQ